MTDNFRSCRLCSRFSARQRILPTCGHSFCLPCIIEYYDSRQRASVMRIGAIPCPVAGCRASSAVPPGGVADFPTKSELVKRSPTDSTSGSQSESRRNSERKSTKRVTFSGDADENTKQERSGSKYRRSNAPSFRSDMKLSIVRFLDRPDVETPDSAFIRDPDPSDSPQLLRGTDSVTNRKQLGETRFVFQTSTSVDEKVFPPEPEANGIQPEEQEIRDEMKDIGEEEAEEKRAEEEVTFDQQDGERPTNPMEVNNNMKTYEPDSNEERNLGIFDADLTWTSRKNEDYKPTSIAFTPENEAIVAEYGKGHLEYLDENGATKFIVEGLKPFAVLLPSSTSGHLVVGDRRAKTLVFIEPQSADVVTQWEPGCFEWVGGLGMLRNNNLVVTDRANCSVGVYTQEGLRLIEFGSYGTGDDNLCMADYLTVDGNDRIIVSDAANHCLKIFDASGTFLSKISGRGTSDGNLVWPKGVCVDNRDNIIVADSKMEDFRCSHRPGALSRTWLPVCQVPLVYAFENRIC